MKFVKSSVRRGMSFPAVIDIVFYKNETGKLYRLRYITGVTHTDVEALHMAICLNAYAPEVVEGEVIMDYPDEVRVKNGVAVYVFQKNAENYKFWDVTEEYGLSEVK